MIMSIKTTRCSSHAYQVRMGAHAGETGLRKYQVHGRYIRDSKTDRAHLRASFGCMGKGSQSSPNKEAGQRRSGLVAAAVVKRLEHQCE